MDGKVKIQIEEENEEKTSEDKVEEKESGSSTVFWAVLGLKRWESTELRTATTLLFRRVQICVPASTPVSTTRKPRCSVLHSRRSTGFPQRTKDGWPWGMSCQRRRSLSLYPDSCWGCLSTSTEPGVFAFFLVFNPCPVQQGGSGINIWILLCQAASGLAGRVWIRVSALKMNETTS